MQLAAVQELMETTYGQRDRARGMPSALAWLASIANQLGLSLDDAIARYARRLPEVPRVAVSLPHGALVMVTPSRPVLAAVPVAIG